MSCRIDIKGLGTGVHQYTFHIDGAFFEAFENDMVLDAGIRVDAELDKQPGCMTLGLVMEGKVTVPCDRCLSELELPVSVARKFAVRFPGAGESDMECADDEITVGGDGAQLDLTQAVYDYVCTSLPIRKVHKDGECDPSMMEKMKDILK